MKIFWTVIRMEVLLFRRGRMIWWLAIFIVFWGLFLVDGATHYTAYNAWFHFSVSFFVLTLLLTFLTGNQLQRDRELRLDSVVWSTPMATGVYVCGKYVAMLLLVIGFAALQLVTSVAVDEFAGGPYPPLGPWPYLLSWCWLALPALVFGSALTLLSTTLSRRWIVSALAVLLIWLLPIVLGGGIPDVLNISGNFLDTTDPAKMLGATFKSSSAAPPAAVAQQVVHLVQVYVPQAHLTTTFLVNRLLFLSLAALLVLVTIWGFRRLRQEN